jgi:hypothetical protein
MLAAARRLKGQRRAASQRAKFCGSVEAIGWREAIPVMADFIPGYGATIPGLGATGIGLQSVDSARNFRRQNGSSGVKAKKFPVQRESPGIFAQ